MTGGADSLGRDWRGTKIAQALPVELDGTQSDERGISFVPTREGLSEYVLRLSPNPRTRTLGQLNDPLNRACWTATRDWAGSSRGRRAGPGERAATARRCWCARLRQGPDGGPGRGHDLVLAQARPAEIDRRAGAARAVLEAVGRLPGPAGGPGRGGMGPAGHPATGGRGQGVLRRRPARQDRDRPDGRPVRGDGPPPAWPAGAGADVPGARRPARQLLEDRQAGRIQVGFAAGKDVDGSSPSRSEGTRFLVYRDDTELLGRRRTTTS